MRALFFAHYLAVCLILAYSCSTPSKPKLVGVKAQKRTPASSVNPVATILEFNSLIQSAEFSGKTCAPILDSLSSAFLSLTSEHLIQAQASGGEPLDWVQALWSGRLELRKKIRAMPEVSPDCIDGTRRVFWSARTLEEYISVWKLKPAQSNVSATWSGRFPDVMLAKGYVPDSKNGSGVGVALPRLRSGDILLSHGESFLSSAIARVPEIESPWSHLGLVYVDPASGAISVIEAQIEEGVKIRSLQDYLKEGYVRSALFRFNDPGVAANAASQMYHRALGAITLGNPIPYDFQFNLADASELFAAELAYRSYYDASQGTVVLPLYTSAINKMHREFINELGIDKNGQATQIFVPADIEVDPRFKLIGEWRDLGRVSESQIKDEVITMMYVWMEKYHYVLERTAQDKFKGSIAWELRRWPVFSRLFQNQFPKNMPMSVIELAYTLNKVGQNLFEAIETQNQRVREGGGRLTVSQVQEALENLRAQDFSQWQVWRDRERQEVDEQRGVSSFLGSGVQKIDNPDPPLFHLEFHPPE